MPVYVAVLYAFIFPAVGSGMVMLLKYVSTQLRPSPIDWVQYVSLVYGLLGTILGITHWLIYRGSF